MLFILAICGGAVLTHSLVPPTPGPIVMAENLHIDLGFIILVGLGTALLPAALTLFLAGWIDRRFPMPVPASLGGKSQESEQLPNVALSVLPILLPVVLIAGASVYKASGSLGIGMGEWIAFLGHKNTAMFLGALCAVALVLREGRDGISKLLDGPFQTAGMIILITSAGGAFGAMIKHSGVPETVLALVGGASVNFVLLGWAVSAVLKIAQGSGTVAMIVTSEMMAGMIDDPSALPYHPVYIALAIGFGSFSLSWMNDSAFWIVGRLCGFNEKQTLQSWTLLLSLLSVFGLLLMLGASSLMPLR
jgi:gluconate:H+ symporter, GntP family